MAKREQPGVAEQQFQYGQSSNVSREMIRAGTAGKSRIRAGLTAAWKAKTSSMYSDETTKLSIALRLIGKQDAAKWIDRFFAKAPTSKKGRRGSRGERGDFGGDVRTLKQVQLNTGLLRAQSLRLNAIHALVDVVASDVLDIKTLITPRKVMVGGRATISSPLNPSTGTASGTMSKEFKDKAQRVHVAETAELVLKIVKEEQDKSELRKKFAWKENDETYKPKDHPDKKTHAKIDHMQEALDEMKRRTGFFSVIKLILANALGMIKRFLGPAGLVAMAGAIGYAVGSYLQTKFKLSEKIGDAIDYVLNKFGIGNTEDKREREYQDMLNAKVADNNLKLLGTDWKQDDLGKFTRISDGQQFDGKDLPKDVQEQFRLRDVGSWANMEQPEWSKSEVTAPPFTTGEYHTPAGGPNKRGALSRKDKGDKYSDLADLIARGEGTSDEKAQKEGYASGYDTTVYYGKYGNTFNDKPVSELTLGEVRLFQRDMIEKQKKEGKGEGERSSALGKYQFTYTTLFGDGKSDPGLIANLGIRMAEKFDGPMQEKLFRVLVEEARKNNTKNGVLDTKGFQKALSGRWASVAKDESDMGYYAGQRASVKTGELQPVLKNIGTQIDQGSREAKQNAAPIVIAAPQTQTIVPTIQNPTPPKPVMKGTALAKDPSFIRSAMRDVKHPTQN